MKNVEDIYPLTPLQQGMLFHSLLAPSSGVYVNQCRCRLEGDLDAALFRRTWEHVVKRHPILRSAFLWDGLERPLQAVRQQVALPWEEIDWRGLGDAERQERLAALAAAERHRPFAFAKAPLLRFQLVRTGEAAYELVWTFHHVLLDGWSTPLLLREVLALYRGLRAGTAADLPPARPFRDYIAWLQRQDPARTEAFWRNALAGFNAPTPLGIDRGAALATEKTVEPGGHEIRRRRLSAETTAALQAFAARHRLTLNTLTQAAWALLLGRYGGEDDVLFGAVVSGRPAELPEVESIIGMFINTLPVRVRTAAEQPLLPWLAALRDQQLELQRFEHSPLVQVQGWSAVPAGQPLFESLFVFENYPAAAGDMPADGLRVAVTDVVEQTSYPLTLAAVPGPALELRALYEPGRFDAAAIERLLGHLETLLAGMLARPAAALGALPLLTAAERATLVAEWSGARSLPAGRELCLHELFEEQVRRRPEAAALVFAEGVWTYGELDRRAGLLAGRLRRLGVGPEVRVGVCLERSPELIATLLAVLKAGGAYVPLDLALPPQRLAGMIEDAAVSVVVGRRAPLGRLPDGGARRLALDEVPFTAENTAPPEPIATAANLAYLIYTSGSTGRPKAVAIAHRSAVERVGWAAGVFSPAELQGVLASTSIAFDLSVFEIFVPLGLGGRVVLAENALALPGLAAAAEVTLINTVPSAMGELAAMALPPSLCTVNLAGEALRPDLVGRILGHSQIERVLNLYGPSEDTTYSTFTEVTADRVTIGRPLRGTRAYVLPYLLDAQEEPLPAGVAGALWLGGAGLARGYLGRPELTADRFRPDPFGGPGERLYQTGDRARWLAGGELEFLGRLDHQVKLRGFRIEPGEVEAALAGHSAVRDAAVVVQGEGPAARLVGWVVAAAEAAGAAWPETEAGLRRRLTERLPAYMVPAALAPLDALPRTPNGKVDRRELARRVPSAGEWSAAAYQAPRTPAEELLAGLFAEILQVERVGVEDSFFDLGGHSLLATQVVSRVRGIFGVELPLRAVFDTPTVAGLADSMERALRSGKRPHLPPLAPAPREGAPPLSFAQARLWFLDRLQPQSAVYNLPFPFRLYGRLDVGALRRAFGEVVRRHESLRTTFAATPEGEPVQVISQESGERLPLVDLSALAAGRRTTEAGRLAAEVAWRPFDLARGPLLRETLLRLSDGEHIALTAMHHGVSDGWSMGVLVRELGALYTAFSAGRPSPLPELPLQYADFAHWQRQWLAGEVVESELAFWRERLAGAAVLELPADRPRPAERRGRGASVPIALSGRLTAALTALGRRRGATPFMVLLAAFIAVLARHSGQANPERVRVGTPVAGRNQVQTESLIGLFVNTLALQTDLTGAPSFLELLARVREVTLAAYAHQDLPFEKLVEELQPERDLSRTPLFQVMLQLQNVPFAAPRLPGLALAPLPLPTATAKLDLTLAWEETPAGLAGAAEYDPDLFDATTVRRLLAHLSGLLEAAVGDAARPVAGLPLLAEGERHQLLVEWNDTRLPWAGPPLLHRWIEAQAARTPGEIAVVDDQGTLTYAELDDRANRLARRLRRLGVGPEVRVAIGIERSLELIVGLLGILKAGGAYVPLDPSYPPERLAFMLEDSLGGLPAPVLLTQEALAARFATEERRLASPLTVLALDAQWEEIAAEEGTPLADGAGPDHLAYVIYTSGSTGRPKGAMNSHRAIVNRLLWMQAAYGLDATDRVLQKTPVSFDVSVWELFWPLMTGARLVLARPEGHRDSAYLLERIAEQGITTLHFVPSMLQVFLEAPDLARCRSLRRVIASGEALSGELRRRFFARLGGPAGVELHNLYGPTEAAVDVTAHACAPDERPSPNAPNAPVPIGRPIANLGIHLLDAGAGIVPVGVPGELHIGGVGLARGYLGRPDLTAERFVPDPWGAEAGGRLYRTGDLARRLPGGELEYLGRIDHQVKIRGVRIEPGEIEAALAGCPGVREAVVLARAQGQGDVRLVGYVVARAGEAVDAAGLRARLKAQLPEPLVPSALVVLDELPLLPNGKVDRPALARVQPLPEPEQDGTSPAASLEGQTAELLAAIFADLLGVERVGPHDGFFERGGHSLLAARLLSRIRDAFGVELPLRVVFDSPTAAGLAARLEREERPAHRPPLERLPREGPLPLSPAQTRLWVLDRLIPGSPVYNLPFGVHLRGALDLGALAAALTEVVRRHEVLRSRFDAEASGEPAQIVEPAGPVPLPVVDLTALPGPERSPELLRLAGDAARRPFDLGRGPLLRAVAVTLGRDEHALLLTLHHIVADGWSMGILVRELAALYEAARLERPSPLPELAFQYADFAAWQRHRLAGEALEADLAYWRERLAGSSGALELPIDRPRPATQSFAGALLPFYLPADLVEALQSLARRQGATLFMTLLAAFQALLARAGGQSDVAVGTPVAGRTHLETEGLIGFFVNTLVLRTDFGGGPSVEELLARVRQVVLGALLHGEAPFEKVVAELQPERDTSRPPLFQVMLALQNLPATQLATPGLTLAPLQVDAGIARFDLTLSLEPASGGGGDIGGVAEYSRDLFDAATIDRLLRQLRRLLAGIAAASPTTPVAALPWLSDGERHLLLHGWNDTTERLPQGGELTFLDLFARQVVAAEVPALETLAGVPLSYRELDERAGRLAGALRRRGVGRGRRVGLYVERSPEAVVAILAILKAGGAYVPLDPDAPLPRLRWLAEDALGGQERPVVLCREATAGRLAAGGILTATAELVLLDAEHDGAVAPAAEAAPEDLAYVIYTSGSTGRPKGVMATHGGLANLCLGQAPPFDVGPGSRVLQFASLSFDASVSEIFVTLAAGGTLCFAGAGRLLPGDELVHALRALHVTTATFPPAALAAMPEVELPELCTLVVAGEACPPELARRWSQGRRLVNAYGPTEATVCATTASFDAAADRLPLGRPLANTQVYILDEHLEPVPLGVAGEICLAGTGLARGYLGRPELTAAALLPDPFGNTPGARLYRTGDLARRTADGEFLYLGRRDRQVKVRGHRIELEEVEAVLAAHPAVREAAAVVREEGPTDRRLVAYVVPREGEVDTGELRRFLRERLPEFMVPAVLAPVQAMPLLSSGKVDRRALARLRTEPERVATPAAARTETEAALARIWSGLLRAGEVGIHDNFFELGGDSILAIQAASRAAQAGLRLTPRQLFEHPTIAALAAVAESAPAPDGEDAEDAGAAMGPVPLTPIQSWFLGRGLLRPEHFNQALLLAGEPGLGFSAPALRRALAHLAAHHDALRLRFDRAAGEPSGWVQTAGEAVEPSLLAVDLAALPRDRRRAALEAAAAALQASFDLGRGPLLRAALFHGASPLPGGGEDRLLLAAHHLIVDGVSWRILLEDLETAYRQIAAGLDPAPLPRTASFGRWAEWLAARAQAAETAAEATWWLRPGPPPATLPVDFADGVDDVASARTLAAGLEAEATRALLQEVPRAYRTRIEEVLLAALAAALAGWTGERRLLVDLERHGRDGLPDAPDTSRTVGWLTALYPVLLTAGDPADPGALLKGIKEQLRAVPGGGVVYGLLAYGTDGETARRLRAAPPAGLLFNYLGQLDEAVSEGRLFRPAAESAGLAQDPRQPRSHPLEVNASVAGGRLQLAWTYGERRYRRTTVEALAERFLEALRELVAHCLTPVVWGRTPADFPLAKVDAPALDRLVRAATDRNDEIEDLYPALPVQQGILFHSLRSPGAGVYVEQMSLTFGPELDVAAFESAWERLVERHPVLRTGFFWEGLERPLQAVYRRARPGWERGDWTGLAAAEQSARLREHLERDRARGFDLASAPLLRLALFDLGEAGYRFVWSHHHILLDGWSLPLLIRELFALYEAARQGGGAPLPPAAPLRDFVAWIERQDLAATEAFWRRELAGFTAPTPLPFEPAAAVAAVAGPDPGDRLVRLPAAATEALHAFVRARGLTLHTALQGVWALLLQRYGGGEDVLFGAVTSGRSAPVPGIESMVGLLINTLPARVPVAPHARLAAWLYGLQERQAALRHYEHTPLAWIQGWSEVPRDQALFDSVLAFENYPADDAVRSEAGRALGVGEAEFIEQTHYPLALVAAPGPRLAVRALYDPRRFDGTTVLRLLGHVESLLAAMPEDPERRLADLPCLTPAERHQAVVEWGGPAARVSGEACLHRLVELQAARDPGAAAVACDGVSVTYGELNARANRLARRLRRLGAGPDVPVGICAERSVDLVVGLLAILKAGGAYVPLDPSYPEDRLAFLVEDALGRLDRPLLLAQADLAERFESGAVAVPPHVRVVRLDDGQDLLDESAENLTDGPSPDHLAYVIYTSGSTGRPKGVAVPHAQVSRLLAATRPWFGFGPVDTWTLFHSFAFDFSVWEIWGALAHGGRLVVVPYWVSRSPEAFYELLARERVTVLNQTPSAFRQVLLAAGQAGDAPRPLALRPLRLLIFGGEALDPAILRPWFERHGDTMPRLVNMYGITETTVHVTYRPLGGDDLRQAPRSPIGIPIPDLGLHLLGPRFEPVPIGVPGEIHVGGAGLARGYLGRPELTAERFVPDPFAGCDDAPAGARLYRSGDLARRRPDGSLDFLGRADHQVKVRGFRIEPGEIEAALVEHPAVREALVLARPAADGDGEQRLIAYLVPAGADDDLPGATELRGFLARRLPEHMIPAAFVSLPALPLTAHGKLDRAALPQPEGERPSAGFVPPRTPRELALARVWERALRVERVGREDNFFALGGDSILSIRVRSLAAAEGLELGIQELFEHPTVAALAQVARQVDDAPPRIAPFALVPAQDLDLLPPDLDDAYPLARLQSGMLFHSERFHDGRGAAPYHNVSSVLLRGPLDLGAFHAAARRLAERHPVLRTSFETARFSEPLQLVHRAAEVPVEVADLRGLPPAARSRIRDERFEQERQRRFDWRRPPLLRFWILLLDADTFELGWTEHHAILDGWSVASLLADLFELYTGQLDGTPPALPPAAAYRELVALERRALEDEGSRRFWRERLAGHAFLELPRWPAAARRGDPTERVKVRPVELPAGTEEGLVRLAGASGVPVKSVLLAAHLRVLAFVGAETDVLTGLVSNGRPESEGGERVLGLFLNTVPLRLQTEGLTWTGLARAAFTGELELLPHRRVPLAELQRLSGGPLFEAAFNYVHFHVLQGLQHFTALGERVFAETNFPLVVNASRDPAQDGLRLELLYDSTELPDEQAGALAGHYARALAAMAEDPDRPASPFPLAAAERHQILVEWAGEQAGAAPPRLLLHELFEAQAARAPEAVALSAEGEELRYGELDARANRLAARLRALGVGPEVRVGLCAERSAAMVVGLVAILKAGGAYVPLDPAYPQERLRFLIADSGIACVLAQRHLEPVFSGTATPWLDLEAVPETAEPAAQPPAGATPECLAYVIYTSGSTGRPKGVGVTHANAVRLFTATSEGFGFGPGDVWTLFHSHAFDFSVWEIWGALAHGGRLVVVPYWVSRSPSAFHEMLVRERVTVLNQTPSAFRPLIEADAAAGDDGLALSWVIFGGEALEPRSLRPWIERHGDQRPALVNMYGITETTVHVTWRRIGTADLAAEARSVIGGPLPDLRLDLLDRRLDPVPVGTPGELFVGGAGVARGYLGRPDLTAERFLPAPFGEPGARMYRSGDLARRLPGGDVEYLGRADHQVKVRGFRIEPGEIEAALMEHPAVREAVVLAMSGAAEEEDPAGERRLTAYLVTGSGGLSDTAELRGFLARRLPEHMIPAAFVGLPALPLTAHGKLDRAALPEPERERPGAGFVPPRTPQELVLARVWERALGVERVGREDNFFALGGDSILSIRVRSLAAAEGLEFDIQELFEHPTVAALAEVARQAGEAPQGTAPFDLVSPDDWDLLPSDLEDAYPLAALQFGMLFHSERGQGSIPYHNVTGLTVRGTLDLALFQRAAQSLIDRHPVLRTSFDTARFSEPLQLVHRAVAVPVEVTDLRALPPAARRRAQEERFELERRRRFDWGRPPLLRFWILLLDADTFELGWTEHHAILDGWSVASLLAELFVLYDSLATGAAPPEPAGDAAFRDFVALERRALEEEASRRFWRERLAGHTVLRLPRWPGGPAYGPGSPRVGVRSEAVAPDTAAALARLAETAGVPIKSVLLAAHMRVLSLLAGEPDVLSGLVVNGRAATAGGERVLGLFLNTVPFRLRADGRLTWLELVRAVFEREVEAMPHRRLPLAEMQRSLGGGEALFEVAFNYIHFHVLQGVSQLAVVDTRMFAETNFALVVNCSRDPAGSALRIELQYDLAELRPEQAAAFADYFSRVLLAMAADAGRPVSPFPLPEEQRHQILREWNDFDRDCPQVPLVHERFAAHARLRPEAVAVSSPHGRLTYGEVEAQANRLAHHLRTLGVGPDVLVAMCTERTLERVIGIVAVLKAGGAYVSLDPTYPRERLAFLLDDARAPVLLTQTRFLEVLPESDARVICLDRLDVGDWETIHGAEDHPPASGVTPENLAYVVYTSGSTGRPKGVEIPHAGLMNLVRWHQNLYGVEPQDRGTQIASPAFDASIWELWPYLAGGASVHVPDEETRLSSPGMIRWWSEQSITLAYLMTPLAEGVLEEAIPPGLDLRVRALIIGGDRLHRRPRPEVGFRLMNHYGPTEYSVTCTVVHVPMEGEGNGIPTIGRPVDNTQIYILDRDYQPTPPGAPGELFVAGIGLARGYLHRPDMTAEKFVPDPFSEEPGARMYRTADMVRYLPDGDMDFLGRLDHQVKLRGLRIELGEIESVLGQGPGVREAVVLVREDRPGDKRLAAYVVPEMQETEPVPTEEELRAFLRERLPEYMVPAAFLFLSALPLTPNGKVDRRALPAPEWKPEVEYEAPRDPVEERIAAIWSEALHVERVGVHDNFFALGGHSLLATRVAARIRQAFAVDLALRHLFEAPTVGGLAAAVRAQQGSDMSKIAQALEQVAHLSEEQLLALLEEAE